MARYLTAAQSADLAASATRPIFIVHWQHSGTDEYLSCSGALTFDSNAYVAGGVNIRQIEDSKTATLVLPATSARIAEIQNNTWRGGACKIYAIPAAPGDTGPFAASDGINLLDGIIESSVFAGEIVTVQAKCKYFIGALAPRFRLSDVAQHIPPAGATFEWEGEKYSYESAEQWLKTTATINRLAGGVGNSINPTVSGRPSTSDVNAAVGSASSGNVPTPGEGVYLPIIYGRVNVPGYVFADTEHLGNKFIAVAWAVGQCFNVEKVFINGEDPPTSGLNIRHYLGKANQQVDPWLSAFIPGFNDDMVFHLPGGDLGVCYSIFNISPAALDGAPSFRAVIQGRLLQDPDGTGAADPFYDYIGFDFVFDQASTTDAGPNSHSITLFGDAYDDAAGLHLDGTGDYAQIADSSTLEMGSQPMSLELEFEATSIAAGTETLISHTNSATTRSLQIDRDGATIKLYLSSDGTTWDVANGVSCGTLVAGVSTRLLLEYNSYDFFMYQDGQRTTVALPLPYSGLDVVTNGGFSADTDWTKGTGWSIASGVASSDGTQTGASSLTQTLTVIEGKNYVVSVDIVTAPTAGSITVEVGGTEVIAAQSATGTYTANVTIASGTSIDVEIIADADFDGDVDNVSFTRVPTLHASGVPWQLGAYNATQEWAGVIYSARLTIGKYRYGAPHPVSASPYSDSDDYAANEIYSEKPALAWQDLASNPLYGLGATTAGISDAAAYGDELLDTGVPRCRIGLSLSSPQRVEQWLDILANHANCIWFPEGGDLKLAPDRASGASNPTGADIVTNGGFSADTDWTKGTGWSIAGGVASSDGTQTGASSLTQTLTTEPGTAYAVSVEIASAPTSGGITVEIGGAVVISSQSAVGTYTGLVTASGASNDLEVIADADFDGSIDNVSVRRSYYLMSNQLRGSISLQGLPDGDEPNAVQVKWTEPDESSGVWKQRTLSAVSYGVAVGEPIVQSTLDMPGITRIEEASNRAIQKLRRSNSRVRVSWVSSDEGIVLQPGDVVQLVNDARGIDIAVWIESSVMISYGRYKITGLQYSDSDFTEESYSEEDEVGSWAVVNGPVVIIDIGLPSGYACNAWDTAMSVLAPMHYWPMDRGNDSLDAGAIKDFAGSLNLAVTTLGGFTVLSTPGLTDNCAGYCAYMPDQTGGEWARGWHSIKTPDLTAGCVFSQVVGGQSGLVMLHWKSSGVYLRIMTPTSGSGVTVAVKTLRLSPFSYDTKSVTYATGGAWSVNANGVSAVMVSASYSAASDQTTFTVYNNGIEIDTISANGALYHNDTNTLPYDLFLMQNGKVKMEQAFIGGALTPASLALLKNAWDRSYEE